MADRLNEDDAKRRFVLRSLKNPVLLYQNLSLALLVLVELSIAALILLAGPQVITVSILGIEMERGLAVTLGCLVAFLVGIVAQRVQSALDVFSYMKSAALESTVCRSRTIAGLMLLDRGRKNSLVIGALLLGALSYSVVSVATRNPAPYAWLALPIALSVAVALQQKLLQFRVKRGRYGFNPHEAKELIRYILSEADKSQFFNDDGSPRKALDERELVAKLGFRPSVQTAGGAHE